MRSESTPLLEWLLGMAGLLLLGASVVFLVREGLMHEKTPGALTIDVDEIRQAGDRYVVRFSVHNTGTQTLSELHLTARLSAGEAEIESRSTAIDFLPGRARREGGFYFEHDPRRYTLTVRPEGYLEP